MADAPTPSVPHPNVPVGPAPLPVGAVCPDCGYDLRGSTSAVCSECGRSLDVFRAGESQIPWSRRQTLGWFRAYWLTVWRVLRRANVFCLEVVRPVSYADAQSFRWVTLLHAYPMLLAGLLAWAVTELVRGHGLSAGDWWWLGSLAIWMLLLLAALPGLASYFFQWRQQSVEQQNRAIALSYYAWAPLVLMPLGWIVGLVLDVASNWGLPSGYYIGHPLQFSFTITALISLATYASLYDFAKHLGHETALRCFLRMALLWALSLGLGLALALIPLAVFYVAVLIESFRG